MLQPRTSRNKGLMSQVSHGNLVLWAMTFQLAVISSPAQNAPGYLGCFEDSKWDRVLETPKREENQQSVEWCFRYCLQDFDVQYKYAGLEYTDECFCGNNEDYDRRGRKPDSDCNHQCAGNNQQICGSGDRISIYRILQGVCSNDIGPPTNGINSITNPNSLSFNLNDYKFFGTHVDFSCDTGYILYGASSIECVDTGNNNVTWSDSVPICEVPEASTELMTSSPTTTIPSSATADIRVTTLTESLPARESSPSTALPHSTEFSTEASGTNSPLTEQLGTGTIAGIAAGLLVALILLLTFIVLLWKRRRNGQKESQEVVMSELAYSHNAYGMPENQLRSTANQPTEHVYSQVIREEPAGDDVSATPGDVTVSANDVTAAQQPGMELPDPSSSGEETEWVDNTLYGSEPMPAESDTKRNDADGEECSAPPLIMKGKPGWVENIIYE